MKVLFLSDQRGAERETGAYTHRLKQLGQALQGIGVQTAFWGLRDQPFSRPILSQPLNLPFVRKQLAGFDYIHAGGDATYTAALWKPFTPARVIHDGHGDTLSETQLKWKYAPTLRKVFWMAQAWITNQVNYRYADYFLAVSRPLQQRFISEKHVPAAHIALVRNGVNLKLFEPAQFTPPHPFTVCYAGSFQIWQGIENLIRAFEQIPSHTARLKIIGFGPGDAALRAQIAARLGDKVELIDRVAQKELVAQLAACHALVIPRTPHRAVAVALPTKFAEYLALGKPTIVCDVDETARLVRQYRCGLVSEPDPTSLAKTICSAAELTQAELRQMGQNARGLAEQEFSWEVIGRKYAELLTTWRGCDA